MCLGTYVFSCLEGNSSPLSPGGNVPLRGATLRGRPTSCAAVFFWPSVSLWWRRSGGVASFILQTVVILHLLCETGAGAAAAPHAAVSINLLQPFKRIGMDSLRRSGFVSHVLPARTGLQREEVGGNFPPSSPRRPLVHQGELVLTRRMLLRPPGSLQSLGETMRGRRGSFLAADEGWEAESGPAAAWRRRRRSGIRSRPRLKALWSCLPSYHKRTANGVTVHNQQGAIERESLLKRRMIK